MTEGGLKIGFGHITRCISLCQAFKEQNILPQFVVNGDNIMRELLKENSLIFDWLKEKERLLKIVSDSEIVIIDSYLADISLYEQISCLTKVPVYIDDIKRLDYPRGIVVNGGIFAEELSYNEINGALFLLGTRYSLLRKPFWNIKGKKINKEIKSVVVTFGGCDDNNMTPNVLKFLNEEYPHFIKNVVIGRGFRNIKEIQEFKDKNVNLVYYPDAEEMKGLMLESDIAISAGGYTLYELARTGVPTVGVCMCGNQVKNLKGWHEKGFVEYAGWYEDEDLLSKVYAAFKLLSCYDIRAERSQIGTEFVDGKGAERVLSALLNY